jgi:hypothetical protein
MPQAGLPPVLAGTWRSFGSYGPVYEILAAGAALPDGDRLMRVRVVESGEELDYRLSQIVADPPQR